MKRIITTLVISIATTFGTSGIAVADSGTYCGSSSNGCDQSSANTICSGHGSFGAFGGKDNNFAGGASGDRTAYYNSILCGNPQGAAGTLAPWRTGRTTVDRARGVTRASRSLVA